MRGGRAVGVLAVVLILALLLVACGKKTAPDATTNADGKPVTPQLPADPAVLAGNVAQYREYAKADYDQAVTDEKIILLHFYSSSSPTSIDELVEAKTAFDQLSNANVVGFKVSINDRSATPDEVMLARQFGVRITNTKLILVNGKVVLTEAIPWKTARFVKELSI